MSRTSAYLAAVASSAVPGLDPVAVRASRGLPGNRFDVGFVTDTQHRAWVVRVPTAEAVGGQLDASADLLPLLAKRVPYAVPSPRGFARVKQGRAVVYPYLHGRSVVLDEVAPGPGVAAEIGRAIAALHNVDRRVFDEAALPVYDAEVCRTRHLADLDRGASTGHVPAALLGRWERVLENVSVWRFAPTPTHGDLTGSRILVMFADDDDAATASVRAVTGWEQATVADPATDFAALAADCSPEAFESIVEAYSVARIERPDRQLRLRARLAAELRLLGRLLEAVTAEQPALVTRYAAALQHLDERVGSEPPLLPQPPAPEAQPTPVRAVTPVTAARPTERTGDDTVPVAPGPPVPIDALDEPDELTGIEEAEEPDEPANDAKDAGDDTQPLRTGSAADATTVIPAHELDTLGAPKSADPEPEPPDEIPGEKDEGDDRGFQVVEPEPRTDPESVPEPQSEAEPPTRPSTDR